MNLSEFISGLKESDFARPVGRGWTMSSSLCHLAFWDQRVLGLLSELKRSGQIDPSRLSPASVEAINQGVNAISLAVPGPAAANLALTSAQAVDSQIASLSDELMDELVSAGLERYLKRFLHRREHLQSLRRALGGGSTGIPK